MGYFLSFVMGAVRLTMVSYFLSTHCAVGGSDAGSRGLLHGRYERVVLQIEPLQVFQGGEAHRKLLEFVRVEVEMLEVTELPKVFRQFLQLIFTQIEFHQMN